MFKIVYLTGAPAAGKSSTAKMLVDAVADLDLWEYGARLTEHVRCRGASVDSQDDVRRLSSLVITPRDVAEVDALLLEYVAERRGRRHVVIDSHPVTKEDYGFRVTPFSLEGFGRLAPDEVWVLQADPETIVGRIAAAAAGRPQVGLEQARMHTMLQASVACTYGMALGIPVHLFDSGGDQQALVRHLAGRLL